MSEYGLFLRSERTGRMYNLAKFAKVLHHHSGQLHDGRIVEIPSMAGRVLSNVVHHSTPTQAPLAYGGETHAVARHISEFGIADGGMAWHAVTPIYAGQMEGEHSILESCSIAGCILNYEDWTFYHSPPNINKHTFLPIHVIMGLVYE